MILFHFSNIFQLYDNHLFYCFFHFPGKYQNPNFHQLSVLPKEKKTFNLKVDVPLKVNKGNYHFVVYAGNAKLPLDVVVAQQGTYQTEFTTDQPNMGTKRR